MELHTSAARQSNCFGFSFRWLLIVVAALAITMLAAMMTSPRGSILPLRATNQQNFAGIRGLHYFDQGHVVADLRTVSAMLQYLVSPDSALPATNQWPVKG